MATDPLVSLMERRNNNPDIDDMALDIEIEQPGTLFSSADAIPEGIEIAEEEDGGVTVDLDPNASRETLDHSVMYIFAVALEDGNGSIGIINSNEC